MSEQAPRSPEALHRECRAFQDGFRSLLMATVDASGSPQASYAPFVAGGFGVFFIYVSALSQHTRDLEQTPRAGVLLIEDERQAQNIFARRRLSFDCEAGLIAREDPEWGRTLDRFEARFGKLVATLRGLADFRLYRLTASSGGYVRGFGQAFSLQGPDLDEIRHRGPSAPEEGPQSPSS
jgi:hypothetical protein